MLEKYETASRLISLDIENTMTEALNLTTTTTVPSPTTQTAPTSTNRKRKLAAGKENAPTSSTSSLKRLKTTDSRVADEDKENIVEQRRATLRQTRSRMARPVLTTAPQQQQQQQQPAKTTRVALQTLNVNTVSSKPCVSMSQPVKPTNSQSSSAKARLLDEMSFANIQFEHVYRVSSKCLTRMLALYIGVTYQTSLCAPDCGCGWNTGAATSSSTRLDMYGEVNSLVTSERFLDFLMKCIDARLKSLRANQNNDYDPLSLTPIKIFKMLSVFWT